MISAASVATSAAGVAHCGTRSSRIGRKLDKYKRLLANANGRLYLRSLPVISPLNVTRMRYLLLFGLLLGTWVSCQAQSLEELPTNLRMRQHHFYAGLTMGSVANMHTISSSGPAYQSLMTGRRIITGGVLGYEFSPRLSLELGISSLSSKYGYHFQQHQYYWDGNTTNTKYYWYIPLRITVRLWQPLPQLAVRAVLGGGVLFPSDKLEAYEYSSAFTDSLASPHRTLTTSYQYSATRPLVVAELGLRADYRFGEMFSLGVEVLQQQSLNGSLREGSILFTDSGNLAGNSTVKFSSQLRSTSINLIARVHFNSSPKYRYRPIADPQMKP